MNREGIVFICMVLVIVVLLVLHFVTERKLEIINQKLAALQNPKHSNSPGKDNNNQEGENGIRAKEPIGFKPSYMSGEVAQ